VVFPALVFLAFRKTIDPWKAVVLCYALLFGLTISTFLVLRWLVPGGFEPRSEMAQVMTNLGMLREATITYPPLLALGPPALLAVLGYQTADNFARACVQLALIIAATLFLQTKFVEFRAEVPILLLLLPAAWFGLLRLTGAENIPAET
jgi:hypothetical protein